MANMQTNEESSLDISKISLRTNEPKKDVVNKKLFMLKRLQVDAKDIKCPLEWWAKHESISNCGNSRSTYSWHCWFSNRN
jgi:hypothetical protein